MNYRSALYRDSRHWLYIRPVFAFGEWALENFPAFACYWFTAGVAEIAYWVSRGRLKQMSANLRHVLRHLRPDEPEQVRERRLRRMVHRLYQNRGVFFADLSMLATNCSYEGLVHFETRGDFSGLARRHAEGKGALVLSGHVGNWQAGGLAIARAGIPLRTVIYQAHQSAPLNRKVSRRGNIRHTYIGDDAFGMVEIVRALRNGEVVAMMGDNPWDSRSIEVPFFGAPARFPFGAARIARLAEVPIYPAFCVWSRPRQFVATICDPIEVKGDDPEAAEREAVTRFAGLVQRFIEPDPSLWFNFNPVWESK